MVVATSAPTTATGAPTTSMITLESEDGGLFQISMEAAKGSQHLRHFMEGCDPSKKFPLPVIKGAILEKVIEYLNHYKNLPVIDMPRPLPSKDFRDLVPEWDYKFTCQEISTIFELILAANYLDIPGLLDLCCAKLASEIRGKGLEEMRALFQIENDFTPEEEQQIREENRWCDPE